MFLDHDHMQAFAARGLQLAPNAQAMMTREDYHIFYLDVNDYVKTKIDEVASLHEKVVSVNNVSFEEKSISLESTVVVPSGRRFSRALYLTFPPVENNLNFGSTGVSSADKTARELLVDLYNHFTPADRMYLRVLSLRFWEDYTPGLNAKLRLLSASNPQETQVALDLWAQDFSLQVTIEQLRTAFA